MIKIRQLSKGQKFFVIMAIFVCGLLFFANAVAFNLFSAAAFANDLVVYAISAAAVTLTTITFTFVVRDIRKGVYLKKQPSLADTQENINKINSNHEFLQSIKAQKNTEKIEVELSEQINQPLKPPITERTKLICPACRKEFTLPTYLGDLMVDFGPRKPSNLISSCRHCGAIIPLKQKNSTEENYWTE